MNIYFIRKNFDRYIFYFLCLSILAFFGSINIKPNETFFKEFDLVKNINGVRFYILYLIFLAFLLICIFRKIRFDPFILIFILYFFSQFMGSLTNDYYESIKLHNYYLGLNSIIFLFFLNILKEYSFDKILIVCKITTLILLLYLIIYLGRAYWQFLITDYQLFMYGQKNFYESQLLGAHLPHVTGIARVVAFFLIYLFVSFFTSKNNKILKFLLLLLTCVLLWGLQSRGVLIITYFSILIFIFLFCRVKIISTFLLTIVLFFSALLLWELNYSIKSNFLNLNSELVNSPTKNNRFLQNFKRFKYLENKSPEVIKDYYNVNDSPITSGRSLIWKRIIKAYDISKFFGYGIQGDRFILKKLNNQNTSYGTSSSNAFLYALSSGGYISVLTLILINLIFIRELFIFYMHREKFKIKNKEKLGQFITILILFILGRSLFENSHAYFGIDFMVICISFYVLKNLNSTIQKN